jgi:hypothetical protein
LFYDRLNSAVDTIAMRASLFICFESVLFVSQLCFREAHDLGTAAIPTSPRRLKRTHGFGDRAMGSGDSNFYPKMVFRSIGCCSETSTQSQTNSPLMAQKIPSEV